MKLILVRHGETLWNREKRILGHTDIDLSETGCEQARLVAGALKDETVAAVYCSPLRRARQTADEVARVHDLEAIPEDGLMELDAGELDGMSFEEAMSSYSEFFKEWAAKGSSVRLPGGESMDGLGERTWSAVERLLERHPDETVIAVSHSLAIQSVVSRALGMDSSSRRRLWLDLASVSILDFGGRGASLLLYNDTCHLRMGA